MTLAVGLITCGREPYTLETVTTFAACNPELAAIRLHADDASAGRENEVIAQKAGFRTIFSGTNRCGQLAMLRRLVNEAVAQGATEFLLLENDWKWVRSLPDLVSLPKEIDCIRLYGVNKDEAGRRPAGTRIMGSERAIDWRPFSKGWERGLAHFGGPPSIIKLEKLREGMQRADSFKAISLSTTHWRTLRPVRNFVWHIGDLTTGNFRA